MGATRFTVVRGGEVDSSTTRLPGCKWGTIELAGGGNGAQIGAFVGVEGGWHGDNEGVGRLNRLGDQQVAGAERLFDQGLEAWLLDMQSPTLQSVDDVGIDIHPNDFKTMRGEVAGGR